MTMRLDAWLVRQGYCGGRDAAKRRIAAGEVTVNGVTARRPSAPVGEGDEVLCAAARYVGRGGDKLEKALALAGAEIPLSGAVALDVGASTGGFTDCLLQHGAAKVYAVDVGHGQLHPALRANPAVVCLEGTDIRAADISRKIPERAAVCTVDVSFISLTRVIPAALGLLTADAALVCLMKPQFEAGRSALGKNGVVKDPAVHREVLRRLCAAFADAGLGLRALTHSPIRGGEGNIEYLAMLRRGGETRPVDIAAVVQAAFREL